MLTVDPKKRPTIQQIKNHKWMQAAEYEPRFDFDLQLMQTDQQEQKQQIFRLMQSLGLDISRIRMSVQEEAYDNFHAIYLLLLERLKSNVTSSAAELKSRRRQSDAPAPKHRPPLNMLRDHSTFQTTDCITNIPQVSHQYAVCQILPIFGYR